MASQLSEDPALNRIDLVVGIPSYNEADNIAFVAEQAAVGLQTHFPDLACAVVNADNFSQDGTREAFLGTATNGVRKVYISTPEGIKGKGNNFLNLFRYLAPLDPRGVVVVDADLKSIQPEWIKALAEPVLNGFDFVSPLYSRNEYDGTITNHLCYPLLYGLLGCNIRQPIGGDFAFSSRLMQHWLNQKWSPAILQYGVDIFMTLEAVTGDFRLAQAILGAKIHKPSAPKLGPMFTQVVDTLFGKLTAARASWSLNGNRPETPPVFNGTEFDVHEPQGLGVDYKALKRQALADFESQRARIENILGRPLFDEIAPMFGKQRLAIRRTHWAQIVYAFIQAYSAAPPKHRQSVVESLKPLYFARVVSFIRETLELDHGDSEDRILRQARAFRRERSILAK